MNKSAHHRIRLQSARNDFTARRQTQISNVRTTPIVLYLNAFGILVVWRSKYIRNTRVYSVRYSLRVVNGLFEKRLWRVFFVRVRRRARNCVELKNIKNRPPCRPRVHVRITATSEGNEHFLPGVVRLGEQTNRPNLNRLGEKRVLDISSGPQ